MNYFLRGLQGEEKLWKIYWMYGWLGLGIVRILFQIISIFFPSPAVTMTLSALYWTFLLWQEISQWQCAYNVGWSGWGTIVRFFSGFFFLCLFSVIALIPDDIKKERHFSYDLFASARAQYDASDGDDQSGNVNEGAKPSCTAAMASYAALIKRDPKEYAADHPGMEDELARMGKCVK